MQILEYEEHDVRELLSRPTTEPPWCEAIGAIEHMIPIRYSIAVANETHLVEAHVFLGECDTCGACPVDEQSVLHSCLTCSNEDLEDFSHDTDGLHILKRHLQIVT